MWIGVIYLYILVRLIVRTQKGEVRFYQFLGWASLWTGILVVSLLPWVSDVISRYLGVERGVDLFMFFAILILFHFVFNLYTQLDQLRGDITRLVRALALRDADGAGQGAGPPKPPKPTRQTTKS